jgi:hypothetical protein
MCTSRAPGTSKSSSLLVSHFCRCCTA